MDSRRYFRQEGIDDITSGIVMQGRRMIEVTIRAGQSLSSMHTILIPLCLASEYFNTTKYVH